MLKLLTCFLALSSLGFRPPEPRIPTEAELQSCSWDVYWGSYTIKVTQINWYFQDGTYMTDYPFHYETNPHGGFGGRWTLVDGVLMIGEHPEVFTQNGIEFSPAGPDWTIKLHWHGEELLGVAANNVKIRMVPRR